MLDSSNFVRLFHRQSFALYGNRHAAAAYNGKFLNRFIKEFVIDAYMTNLQQVKDFKKEAVLASEKYNQYVTVFDKTRLTHTTT